MLVGAKTINLPLGFHKPTDGSRTFLNHQVMVLIPLILILDKLVAIQLAFPFLIPKLRLFISNSNHKDILILTWLRLTAQFLLLLLVPVL